jgi:hypothetical protein
MMRLAKSRLFIWGMTKSVTNKYLGAIAQVRDTRRARATTRPSRLLLDKPTIRPERTLPGRVTFLASRAGLLV